MSSIEQTIRTRLGTFLDAVNLINALGFEEVYTTPPPNFPTARAMVVEIESEESARADGAGYVGDAHATKRTFNVKIACVWGEVDPTDQTKGIEDKVVIIRDAIEQSSWLLAEDTHGLPEFEEIHVIGIGKRYRPEGWMDSGIISLQFVYHEAWNRDNTYAVIAKPDIASGFERDRGGYTLLTWTITNSAGITGYKVYLGTTSVKPATPLATLPSTILTYNFPTTGSYITYYMWVCSYNGMMEVDSVCSLGVPITPTGLLHFDGADGAIIFTDEAGKVWERNGEPTITTAQSVFGGASGWFAYYGHEITSSYHSDWDLGADNFTIALRFRAGIGISVEHQLYCIYVDANNYAQFQFIGQTKKLHFKVKIDGFTIADYSFAFPAVVLDTWYHIELVRVGAAMQCRVNGVALTPTETTAIGSSSITIPGSPSAIIGPPMGYGYHLWIDELLTIRGAALHTKDFIPPTSAYTMSISQ